jgi:hypothetical protein
MSSPSRITLCTTHVPPELVPSPTYAFHDDDVVVTDVMHRSQGDRIGLRHTPSAHRDGSLMPKAVLHKHTASRHPRTNTGMSKTNTPMKRISTQVASHTPIKRKPTPPTRTRIPSSSRVLAYVPKELVPSATYTAVINNTRLKQPLICAALTTPVCLTHRRDVHNHKSPSGMDEIL